MTSIQEALKSSDWITCKVAAASLGEIPSSGGPFCGSFKMSCICSLESCCFDKVKPVRDTVLQVLHRWRCFPRPDTPEPSEAGSSSKENFCAGDYGDIFSVNESGCKDVMLTKVGFDSIKKRTPLSTRKACQDFVENSKHSKENCWHIEIAVPGTHNVSSVDVRNEESGVSSITKTFERMIAINTSPQDVGYEYMPIDDRQECSSVSNLVTDNSQTKFVMVSDDCLEEGGMVKSMGINQRFADVEISILKMRDGRSLDSTLTESGSQTMHGCCLQTGNEMVFTRKQLLEIQNKQSNLMDLLKVFTTSTMDSLSMIQLKVSGLGHIVDRIAQDLVQGGRYSDLVTAKFLKKITSIASPRLSTSTPRPSVDIRDRQPSLLSMKNTEVLEEKTFTRSRSSSSAEQGVEMWTDPTFKLSRNCIGNGSHKSSGHTHDAQRKKIDAFAPASTTGARENNSEINNNLWKLVKDYLSEADIDSAYTEVMCSADEPVLILLLDTTGPALASLSHKTATDLLSILATYFLEHRFINSTIPWLQQVVDLTTIHGPNYLILSAKARKEF